MLIVAPPRTGSTMLRMALNRHPQILMHGEVLGKNVVRGLIPLRNTPLAEATDDSGRQRAHKALFEERRRDFAAFLKNHVYVSDSQGIEVVGFKLLTWQALARYSRAAFAWLRDRPEVDVIFNIRRDWLARYVSEVVFLHKTRAGADAQPIRFHLDVKDFVKRTEEEKLNISNLREAFASHRSMDVFYEDCVGDLHGSFSSVYDFLNVDTGFATELQSKKAITRPLSEVIANFEQISTHPSVRGYLEEVNG